MPAATRRDMIVDFVTASGQARAVQIAAHLGVPVSLIGGHLRALVRQGRLVRLRWGLYAPGGQDGPQAELVPRHPPAAWPGGSQAATGPRSPGWR